MAHFSLSWGNRISRRCVTDILSKRKSFNYRHHRFNANIGGGQSVAL
jgi:hypothetical protein